MNLKNVLFSVLAAFVLGMACLCYMFGTFLVLISLADLVGWALLAMYFYARYQTRLRCECCHSRRRDKQGCCARCGHASHDYLFSSGPSRIRRCAAI